MILLHLGRDDFGQVATGNISAFQAPESSEQTRIQPPVCATEACQDDLNGYETFAIISQLDPNNLPQSNMAGSGQHWTQSDLTTTLPTTGAVDSQIPPTIPISQTSIHIERCTEPPRDSKGRIICDRDGCSSITFRTNSAWR